MWSSGLGLLFVGTLTWTFFLGARLAHEKLAEDRVTSNFSPDSDAIFDEMHAFSLAGGVAVVCVCFT